MKILTAEQIRAWDEYTIRHEPVASIHLMERAALCCAEWIEKNILPGKTFLIFCGKGNNGGDGLAMARLLWQKKKPVTVFILETAATGSADFEENLSRLQQIADVTISFIRSVPDFPSIPGGTMVIDALFGSGLSRALEGIAAKLVEHINSSGAEVISIDVPSGLFIDKSSKDNAVVQATHTLSIQTVKLAFLVSENAGYTGNVHVIDIGLLPEYLSLAETNMEWADPEMIRLIYKPRDPFAHKGKYGHALLVAGEYGKMGAAILAAKACLRSGVGLLTCHIPPSGYDIMQQAVPEAMVVTESIPSLLAKPGDPVSKYNTAGIGPGLGTAPETITALKLFFSRFTKPVVMDADGLNCLSLDKELFSSLPRQSVITPHPKEFERLFGQVKNDFERIEMAMTQAKLLRCILVLKGHHTLIATPEGKAVFNSTGNAGMAKGGSGDVLTGILTALLAQGYSSENAAIFGVYLHGLAGDLTAEKISKEAMVAGDIVNNIGNAFKEIAGY